MDVSLSLQLQDKQPAPKKAFVPYPPYDDPHWFGYRLRRGWLDNYASTVYKGNPGDLTTRDARTQYHAAALADLSRRTGVKNLSVQVAYPPGCLAEEQVDDPFTVLTLFAWPLRSCDRQPLQAQLDKLSKIMKRKPKWWADGFY